MRKRMKTGSYVVYSIRDKSPLCEVWSLETVHMYRSVGHRVVSILTHLQSLNACPQPSPPKCSNRLAAYDLRQWENGRVPQL